MNALEIDGVRIEYEVHGSGEPVLLIPVGLVADGLARPLLGQPELAAHYQLIHYHRRGYAGSTTGSEPPTIPLQAGDAAALLRHLGVKRAHVAGHSIGGLIALQLALDAPGLVHSLALLEPVLQSVPSGKDNFERAILPMLAAYRAGDRQAAIDIFGDAVFHPGWQPILERAVPGGARQAVGDFDSFARELSTIQEWQFGPAEAAAIRQPVLSVLGIHGNQIMVEGRALLHEWLPQTEDLDVPTTHLLQMQDPVGVARGMAEFFARHPMA